MKGTVINNYEGTTGIKQDCPGKPVLADAWEAQVPLAHPLHQRPPGSASCLHHLWPLALP